MVFAASNRFLNFLLLSTLVITLSVLSLFFPAIPLAISAEKFKQEEGISLNELKTMDLADIYKKPGVIYLMDVRSRKDFLDSHIKNSFSFSLDSARSGKFDETFRDRLIAIYSWREKYDESYAVAQAIKQRGVAKKVYVIREGFEGLRDAGLETEVGPSFD